MRSDTIWTSSNLLSFARILLAVPVCVLLARGSPPDRLAALVVIVVAALTDYFDGYLARRYNQVTELGRILDPLADKLAVGSVAVVLGVKGDLPVWFITLVLIRDLLILAGAAIVKRRKALTLESNRAGKIAVGLVACALLAAAVGEPELALLKSVLLAGSTLMLLVSFVLYAKRFLEIDRRES